METKAQHRQDWSSELFFPPHTWYETFGWKIKSLLPRNAAVITDNTHTWRTLTACLTRIRQRANLSSSTCSNKTQPPQTHCFNANRLETMKRIKVSYVRWSCGKGVVAKLHTTAGWLPSEKKPTPDCWWGVLSKAVTPPWYLQWCWYLVPGENSNTLAIHQKRLPTSATFMWCWNRDEKRVHSKEETIHFLFLSPWTATFFDQDGLLICNCYLQLLV